MLMCIVCDMEKNTFGSMVAELRKEKGMTQADLAEKMGITDKAVSKWERDLSYPDIASIPRLAEILGVSVDELLSLKRPDGEKGKAKTEEYVTLALNSISVAMGIAVVVLAVLDELSQKSGTLMLGIGLSALAINMLRNSGKKEE